MPSETWLLFVFLSSHPQRVRISPTLVTVWPQQVQALQPHVTTFLSKKGRRRRAYLLSFLLYEKHVSQKTPSKLPPYVLLSKTEFHSHPEPPGVCGK